MELGQLKFLVRIQGGVRPQRPFCSSLALIGHNQGVGEYVMAWDELTHRKWGSNDRFPAEHVCTFVISMPLSSYSITYSS